MQKQLRALAALAAFVVVIVVVAFLAAFRNTGGTTTPPTHVRLDAKTLRDGQFRTMRATTDVLVGGEEFHVIDLFVVHVHGRVHALWSRSTHLGCRTEPRRAVGSTAGAAVFEDPCGGSMFALDGACLSGPCPRALDEFPVIERDGALYADLAHLQRGQPRSD